jgi:hypothetical protein
VLTHIRPGVVWFTSTGAPLCPGPTLSGYSWSGQVPRAPVHGPGVTSHVMVSRTMAVGITPPSSLLRAHAPVLLPPHVLVIPSTPGLCRLLSAPAGRRTFPTLSLRLCPCVLGPLPRRLVRCVDPLLPPRPRPSPRAAQGGAPRCPIQRLPDGALCEAAVMRCCAGPPVCSPPRSLLPLPHRRMAAVTFPSEPLVGCYLPTPRIGLPSASGN